MMETLPETPRVYTLNHTRCILGWKIYMNYCKAWEWASLAQQDLPEDSPYRISLVSDRDRAIEAHRIHQITCPDCSARKQELDDLGAA